MSAYTIITPSCRSSFAERIAEIHTKLSSWKHEQEAENRRLSYVKVFLSDIQNQYAELKESALYEEIHQLNLSVIEQPPACGSKIALLVRASAEKEEYIFEPLRVESSDNKNTTSYAETYSLFERYEQGLRERGLDIRTHLLRTWIYVADIDVNYDGVVRARNDFFRAHGLTADTHFIASTGIGGATENRHAKVAIDFLTFPNATASDIRFLQALTHLGPTHHYGVAFERGTLLKTSNAYICFISGTASIDTQGNVLHKGDVEKQTSRLLENIGALLADGGMTINDANYFIVYLRDMSDHAVIDALMHNRFPHIPYIILGARVCRPEWLIEMECTATRKR